MSTPTPAAALRAAGGMGVVAVGDGQAVELRCSSLASLGALLWGGGDCGQSGQSEAASYFGGTHPCVLAARARLVEADAELDAEFHALAGDVDVANREAEEGRERERGVREEAGTIVRSAEEKIRRLERAAAERERDREATEREAVRLASEVEGLRRLVEARERAFEVQVDIVADLRALVSRLKGDGEKEGLVKNEEQEDLEDDEEYSRLKTAVMDIGGGARVGGTAGPPRFSMAEMAAVVGEHTRLQDQHGRVAAELEAERQRAAESARERECERDDERLLLQRKLNKVEAEFRAVQKAHDVSNAELSSMRARMGGRRGWEAVEAAGGAQEEVAGYGGSGVGGAGVGAGVGATGTAGVGGRGAPLKEAKGQARRGQTAGRMPKPGRTDTSHGSRIKNVLGSLENNVVVQRVRQLSSSSSGSARR